jgi:hypothetical protein
MAFDYESGLAGAQTGAAAGPYGAIAGFVVGGFVGGRKKDAMRKLMKKREKKLRYLASPKHLAEVTSQLTPQFRQQIAGGAGAAAQSAIQNSISRRGLSGTGIGAALGAGAAAIPEITAFNQALGQAGNVINRQTEAYGQQYYDPERIDEQIGKTGDAIQLFKRLSAGSGGPEGGLTRLGEGEFDRLVGEGGYNPSASEEFKDQDFDFSQFGPR